MFKRVKPYMKGYMQYTIRAAISISVAVILSIIPYFILYQIIEPLVSGRSISGDYVLLRVMLIALCMAGNALLYVHGLSLSHYSAFHTLENLRIALQKKIEKQSLGDIKRLGNGRLKKVFTDDIDNIEILLAHAIPEGVGNITIPLFVIISMFFTDWKLALLSLCSLPIGIFAIGMLMKLGMGLMSKYYEIGAKMNNTIIEYINGMEVVKVFNRDGESYKRFETDIDAYRDMTLDWYKICWPWMALYSSIIPCVALFTVPIGGILVLNGFSSLADFILIICMSLGVGIPLLKALGFAGKFPQLNYKIEELEKLLEFKPLIQSDRGFEGKNHDIEFKDVHFSYEDTEVIHGINLELKEGTMTAFVGESGSGKSTLAKLLVHFYDVNSGEIRVGGQPISDMSIEALNNQISYVSQEQFLFNTSLYENIKIGNPDASREDVLKAASLAECGEFIDRFTGGIESRAGDGGSMLSGGERQRISLARALLKNAPIIVLDEATAFIDPENEEKMNRAISKVIKGKTVIVIAHRLRTVTNADQIVVLNEGKISDIGSHKELLENSEIYRRLWSISEESAEWEVRK